MVKRAFLLGAAHLLAVTVLAYSAGAFTFRTGVNQFFGHLSLALLLAVAGLISISGKMDMLRLIRIEAYLGLIGAFIYILVDSFIMHPPFGIFDGAGRAEQQHVSLYMILIGLASFVLVTLRYTKVVPSVQIFVAAAAFVVVLSTHGDYNPVSVIAHQATMVFVVLAAVLRLLERMFDYGVMLFLAAHTFFGSQTGLAQWALEIGIDPGAWAAYWITAASLAVAAYIVAMRREAREIL